MANYDDAFSGGGYTLRLIVNTASQNLTTNVSTLSWSLRAIKTGSGNAWSTEPSNSFNVKINGSTRASGQWDYDFRNGVTTVIIATGTYAVAHNADGTKSVAVSAAASSSFIGSASKSGTYTIATIPRASTPTFEQGGLPVTSVEAGTSVDIITNRASAGFTHDMSYSFGTQSGFIGSAIGAETSWTPPLTLLSEIPTANSGAVQIITDTYNGATLIGSKTVTLTITVPAGAAPSFTSISHSEATTSPNVASLVGGYVKGISSLSVALVGAAAQYGASIVSQKIEVGDIIINAGSGTTPILPTSGTITVRGTVTDSRGVVYTNTTPITVLNYAVPAITAATAVRATAAGVPAQAGTYVRVDLTAVVQSLIVGTQKNNLTYRIRTRERTATTPWPSITPVVSASAGSTGFNDDIVFGTFPISESHTIRIEVEDVLGSVSAVEIVIPTGGVQVHFPRTDDGIGVGKYWEQGSVDALNRMYQRNGKAVLDVDHLVDASTTVKGVVELATSAETVTGTDTVRAVTPAGFKAGLGSLETQLALFESERPVKQVLTGASSIIFDNLNDADEYHFLLDLPVRSTTNNIIARLRSGGTAATTGYDIAIIASSNGASTPIQTLNGAQWSLALGARDDNHIELRLFRLNDPVRTIFSAEVSQFLSTTQNVGMIVHGRHRTAAVYDGIEFTTNTGTVTGIVTLSKKHYL